MWTFANNTQYPSKLLGKLTAHNANFPSGAPIFTKELRPRLEYT